MANLAANLKNNVQQQISFFQTGAFTGKQQGGLQSLFDTLGGSTGEVENKAASSGMDPALIQGVISMLSGGAGGAASGGSGFNLGSLLQGKKYYYFNLTY